MVVRASFPRAHVDAACRAPSGCRGAELPCLHVWKRWCAGAKHKEEPQGGCAKGFLRWAGEFGLGNTFSLFVGVGSRVLTQNKSQNRGPDLLKVWARAINAVSNMGVPALPKHPPEAANWRLLTAPAGKSPPGPARRTRRPKSLPASMAAGPTVWGRTGPPPVGQAAQPKGDCCC